MRPSAVKHFSKKCFTALPFYIELWYTEGYRSNLKSVRKKAAAARGEKQLFDLLINENDTEYGILKGDGRLFYVKVGNGGGLFGKDGAYIRIARGIWEKHGCSVLVASTPTVLTVKECMLLDGAFIEKHFPKTTEIYAFGHSKGGQMLGSYAYLSPKIRRVLALNAPLMINFHRTKEGIARFSGEQMTFLYGENDPSARYTALLNAFGSSSLAGFDCRVLPGADHGFDGMLEEFVSLPDRFLFRHS
jgi:hypothetical protein